MKIVFFGTPDYVVPVINVLHKTFKSIDGSCIKAVVTQPPQPTGRQKINTFSAVDDWAHKKNILKFYEPLEIIRNRVDADLAILAAYGAIIPKSIIDYFHYGILNIHPSLLPNFRGASPLQSTIATNGECGVSIIKLDEKMDHGPIVTQFRDNLEDDDTLESLRIRLFEKSADVLKTLLPPYIKGKINLKPQNHDKATFTKLITKDDGFIDWRYLEASIKGITIDEQWEIPFIKNYHQLPSATNIERYVRALTPWPGVWTYVKFGEIEKRLKILEVSENDKVLEISKVQLEGKNSVSWKQFNEVYKII